MKYLTIITICLFSIACSVETSIDLDPSPSFVGTYSSELNCEGDLAEDNGEPIVIVIRQTAINNLYDIDMGDDVIFQGVQTDDMLIIAEQTLNEESDFDVITLAGQLEMDTNDALTFNFEHEVDDEGRSTCSMSLIKQ